MIGIVKNGQAQLRQDSGVLIRNIGSNNAVSVSISNDEKMALVCYKSGKVELRHITGVLVRTIGNGHAVNAAFHGEDVLLELENGKNELRRITGTLIRTF